MGVGQPILIGFDLCASLFIYIVSQCMLGSPKMHG